MTREKSENIDEYIALLIGEQKAYATRVRELLRAVLPKAQEKISWGMPTYFQGKNLIHFCAHSKHIGLYPGDSGVAEFSSVLDSMGIKYSKGAIQLPYSKPLPVELIVAIAKFKLKELG